MMKMEGMKAVPSWRHGIILIGVSAIFIFTCLPAMDVETVLAWARISSRNTAESRTDRNDTNRKIGTEASPSLTPPSSHDTLMNVTHDPACLARTQHLLYRRDPERFAPSPAFTAAWDRYVAMHKSCSHSKNWTHVFLNERDKVDNCTYLIVMEGPVGLGNNLLSLTSAFAYGLATDRVVLVESTNHFKELLCDPFPGSSWFLPEGFPYKNVTDADSGAPGLDIAIDRNFTDMSMVFLRLNHTQTSAEQQFFCDHTHFGLTNIRWLGWISNQYYLTTMMMVPSIWERLNPLFAPGEVFTILSHKILLPRNELWAHIVRVYLGYLAGSSKRVGVQVRLHGRANPADYDPEVFDRIVDCLQTREVLPRLKSVKDDVSDLMSLARKGFEGTIEISVLVASLQLRYYDEMKDLYAEKPNVNNTVIRFHMVSHLEKQDRFSMQQAEMAFLEIWLLSFSDVLATSAYSTFGYIPHGIGGVTPIYLNMEKEVESNGTVCWETFTTEPCTHFPQKPRCDAPGDSNAGHSEWMRHHVRECLDKPCGLQLLAEVPQPNPSSHLWEHHQSRR